MRIDVVSAAAPLSATNATASTAAFSTQNSTPAVDSGAAVAASVPVQQARNEALETEKQDTFQMPESSIPTAEEIEKLIGRGNSLFKELKLNEHFELRRHEKLQATMIRLVDLHNDRVIREYPPKNYLDLVAALQELSGLMVDERV